MKEGRKEGKKERKKEKRKKREKEKKKRKEEGKKETKEGTPHFHCLYIDEWVETLLNIFKNINKNKKSQKDKPHNVLLILDDCCSNTKFHNSKTFEKH